jgi:hypothetical protein
MAPQEFFMLRKNNAYYRCGCPGLAPAWLRGSFSGVFELLAFSLLLNTLLIASFVWPQWGPAWLVRSGWVLCGSFWVISACHAYFKLPKWLAGPLRLPKNDLLMVAQTEYLRGNWFEAESLLSKHLLENPDDISAALLLAGVLRRSKRWKQSELCLEQIRLRESSARWNLEIQRELEILTREAREETVTEDVVSRDDSDESGE